MRRIRLRDFFLPVRSTQTGAGKPASNNRGKGGKDKPAKQLPFDPDGLMERALDGDEPDIEGFAQDASKESGRLWHSFEDSVERESSLLDRMKRSGTSDRRRRE